MNNALVIVPTYNERDNLRPLVERLLALPMQVELLIVDDNSPDGTGALAEELAGQYPFIHVLFVGLPINRSTISPQEHAPENTAVFDRCSTGSSPLQAFCCQGRPLKPQELADATVQSS